MKKQFRIMQLLFTVVICLFSFLISSCELFSDESEDAAVNQKNVKPDVSVLCVSFNGVKTESRGSVYQVDYNRDISDVSKDSFHVELKHLAGDEECNYKWTFSSDDIKIYNVSSNSFSVPCSLMTRLGLYTVKAQSEVSGELDKVFIINCKSEITDIVASYRLDSSFMNEELDYEDGMVSGVITRFTKELTLVSGAEYLFTVEDASQKNIKINEINVRKDSDSVSVREFYDNTFTLVCKALDGAEAGLLIEVEGSNANLSVNVILKDVSKTRLRLLNEEEKKEEYISLVKNPSSEPDKRYTFKIDSVSPLENRIIDFSFDFEDWSPEAENDAVKSPYFKAKQNKSEDIHWLRNSSFYRTFGDKTLFKAEVDGAAGTFTIIPRNNTVFTHQELLTEHNLHCYMYVKYAEDDVNTYRQKWRIMVGGRLEGLEMVLVDAADGSEKRIENDISIREGDETGWIFRAKYIPSTTENRKTLWYLSASKSAERFYSGDFYFDAPVPLSDSLSDKNKQKVVNFMEEGSLPFIELSSYENESGTPFIAYKYFFDEAEGGFSDLWATYNSLALDVVLVALNIEEKRYVCVGIKDLSDKLITVKSLNANALSFVYNNATGYASGEVQCYPNTIVPGFESERTFYMDVRETLKLRVDSSFRMTSFDVWGDSEAREIFPSLTSDLDESGLSGVIKMQTLYTLVSSVPDGGSEKRNCLSQNGVILYVKINNRYVVKLRIVIHEDGSND